MSAVSVPIIVLLSSEKFSFISISSFLISWTSNSFFCNKFKYSLIFFPNSFASSTILSLSKPVNFWSLKSKIASACSGDKSYFPAFFNLYLGSSTILMKLIKSFAGHSFFKRLIFASFGFFEFLINLITKSKLLTAIIKPVKLWTLSLAFDNSKKNLFLVTSSLKDTKILIIFFKSITSGLVPSFSANALTPKLVLNWVCLNKFAKIISGFAPFLISTTILTPSRLDSSLISEISSTILFFVTSAIFSTNLDLLIVYGISVTIIDFFLSFDFSSIWTLDSMTIDPFPVLKADSIPLVPFIIPPVGKSGPFTNFVNSSIVISLLSIYAIHPSITSPKLWGGIFVAIPTAIPLAPLTNKFGTFDGNTVGSIVEPS